MAEQHSVLLNWSSLHFLSMKLATPVEVVSGGIFTGPFPSCLLHCEAATSSPGMRSVLNSCSKVGQTSSISQYFHFLGKNSHNTQVLKKNNENLQQRCLPVNMNVVNRKRQIICDFFQLSENYVELLSHMFWTYVVDLFAGLFRIFWLRPGMPFLKLLNSTYWQEGRAVTNCALENCRTEHIRNVSRRRAAELPSPCVHPYALPLPQLSPDGGRKVKRTEEQELLYTSGRGRGRKGMKKPKSFVSRWNLFPSTQKKWLPDPCIIKGLKQMLSWISGQFWRSALSSAWLWRF